MLIRLIHHAHRPIIADIVLFLLSSFQVAPSKHPAQDDPILAPDIALLPVIDGTESDLCWQHVPWQSIEQVWMPYGASVDSTDYSGKYKVVWSSVTNLIYFLVRITDDVFVDGYIPEVTSDIYNFDVVEVFIDEDRSGGLHVFDGTGATGLEWGTKAVNAFAYHIYAPFPGEREVATTCYVYDLAGTSWSDAKKMDYTFHLPEIALRRSGNTAVWEFSLIVYKDTYADTMANKDAARAQLQVDKVMGLSLAYCDNDDPNENPKTRDNERVFYETPAMSDHFHSILSFLGMLPLFCL